MSFQKRLFSTALKCGMIFCLQTSLFAQAPAAPQPGTTTPSPAPTAAPTPDPEAEGGFSSPEPSTPAPAATETEGPAPAAAQPTSAQPVATDAPAAAAPVAQPAPATQQAAPQTGVASVEQTEAPQAKNQMKVKITSITGQAQFRKSESKEWDLLRVGMFLKDQHQIKTGIETSVEVGFRDGSKMLLKENTTITLAQLQQKNGENHRKVKVDDGILLFNIKPLTANSTFHFDLATNTASIRGTRGGFSSIKGSAGAYLDEGAVDMQGADGTMHSLKKGDVVFKTKGGKSAKVVSDKPMDVFTKTCDALVHDVDNKAVKAFEANPEQFLNQMAGITPPAAAAPSEQPAEAPAVTATATAAPDSAAPAKPDSAKADEKKPEEKKPATKPKPVTKPAGKDSGKDEPKEEPKEEKEAPKTGMTGNNLAIGIMDVEGERFTRIAYQPEFSIGKLGVALDVELFVDSEGNLSSYGWNFDDTYSTLNTIYRKIYYVRWAQPGDKFYLRAGALEGITMDAAGLVTSGYGNVALYPGQKQLGVHTQLNDIGGRVGLSLEAFTNGIGDWTSDDSPIEGNGGVLGAKTSFTPFRLLGLNFLGLGEFRMGGFLVSDMNQYASIRDKDGDGCPDEMDDAPNNKAYCVSAVSKVDESLFNDPSTSDEDIIAERNRALQEAGREETAVRRRFDEENVFTMIGADYSWPLISTKILNIGIYGEGAIPYDTSDAYDEDWGVVPVGASMQVSILSVGVQYQIFNGRFQPGHFDGLYEAQRIEFIDGDFVTKEQANWNDAFDMGRREGVFGTAGLDLGGFVNVGGDYSIMWGEDGSEDEGYEGRVSLGEKLTELIPKLSKAEYFYGKDHVGQDDDDFFEKSIYTTHGYSVGVDMGGTQLIWKNITYYKRENGKLEPQTSTLIETAISF